MVRRTLKVFKNVHGSALIIALVTTVVLATLALALLTLAMGNLTFNQADAMNNDAYYAAKSGANSALEQLKYEVLDYYNQMIAAEGSNYDDLYDNFFSGISSNAQTHFLEPNINGISSIQTSFTNGSFDSDNEVGEFLISSTATAADGSQYRVDAKLYVKRLDVSAPTWLTIDDVAYKIGGTLTLNAGYGVYNGGNVIASLLYNPKNIYYSVAPPGKFYLNPDTTSTINDCLTYPSYNDPVLGAVDYIVTTNNAVLNSNTTLDPAKQSDSKAEKLFSKPRVIVSEPGISFTIAAGTDLYPGTIIYKRGAGTLTISSSNTGHTITCYSDGDVVTSSGPVYADIYCRGNVSTSGNFHGNIVCDGNATESCNTFVGSLICKGYINCNGGLQGSFFAEGPITISNGNQGNNVIYSKTKVSLGAGNYQNVVLFSGGDIDINGGSSLTGAICAKGNVNQNAWLTLNYSRTAVQNIMDNPNNSFFFSGGSGGEIEVEQNIIIDQEVTAVGRLR